MRSDTIPNICDGVAVVDAGILRRVDSKGGRVGKGGCNELDLLSEAGSVGGRRADGGGGPAHGLEREGSLARAPT